MEVILYSKINDKNMFSKKIIAMILFVIFISAESVVAQIEINGYTGYVPGSKTAYNYSGYRLRIDGSQNFGAGLGLNTPVGMIEFNYMGYASSLSQDGGITELVPKQPININYYQIGILKPLIENKDLIPYGMFTLGASQFKPEEYNEVWRFSVAAGLGVRYFFTPLLGVRLQARLLMPLYFGGVGFGCGSGGCGSGAYFGVEIFQGDFTGGVVFRIDK